MPLALVLHQLAPGSPDAAALSDAIFEIAPEHWALSEGAVLVATSVSPGYLLDYLSQALRRRGHAAGLLLVTQVSDNAVWSGLRPEGEAWLREVLGS